MDKSTLITLLKMVPKNRNWLADVIFKKIGIAEFVKSENQLVIKEYLKKELSLDSSEIAKVFYRINQKISRVYQHENY